ncbi:MAG: helix-turn-helix transcriptional regulator [Saprospiraceae bacterium]|nr:helix-turn-helix transcriptional regulator [Saprospiraceae bacterium]
MGDHLRKVRLDRGLSQQEVAICLNVTTNSITGWELNRNVPTVRMAKRIIEFLGYVPIYENTQSFEGRLYLTRMITGKTQAQVAKEILVDQTTLRRVELGSQKPVRKTREKIEAFIKDAFERFTI